MDNVIFIVAIISSVVFGVQFISAIAGFDFDVDFDFDVEFGGMDFHYLNVKAICMFLMSFSWTYVICDSLSIPVRLIVGFILGVLSMCAIIFMMKKMHSMDESVTETVKTPEMYLDTVQMLTSYYNGVGYALIDGKECTIISEEKAKLKCGDMVTIKEVIDYKTFKI